MQKKKQKLSYTKFTRDIQDAAKEIQESYDFDFIVGINRGGAVPAIHLSHILNKPVDILNWSLNDKMFPGGNVISYSIMGLINEGKKILIVDDILDDGDTLAKLFREWGNRKTNLNNVKIFTVHYNKNNKHGLVSDFYMYEHNPKFWQVYPWEYDL